VVRSLLADRRTRLFFLGNAISDLGDDALILALAVWVKELTGSTALSAIDLSAIAIGTLFSPLTGILVDRVRRKPLLLTVYLITGAMLLALLAVRDSGQVWLVLVVTFLYGLSGTTISGAQTALMKTLVPAEQLADANGLQQTLQQVMRLVTPALGIGVLAWWGGHVVALADAATFLLAAACLAAVRIPEQKAAVAPGSRPGWLAEAGTGFRVIWRSPVLRPTTSASAVMFFIFGIFVPLGLQVITVGLHRPPTWLAFLITEQGIFGSVGALAAGPAARRLGDARITIIGLVGMAVSCSLIAVPSSWAVYGGMAVFSLSLPWFFVGVATLMQKNTPNEVMGRVSGARSLAIQAPQAIGNLAGAGLVLALPYRTLTYLVAAVIALTAMYLGARARQWTTTPSRRADAGATAIEEAGAEPAG
jgi:MFS family permease